MTSISTTPTSHRVAVGALLLLFANTGCRPDTILSTATPSATEAARVSSGTSGDAARLSAALARALRSAPARSELHRALRQSPYTLHKVYLQQHLREVGGRKLLESLAEAMNSSPDEVLNRLDALPALEMSLPVRRHRIEWRVADPLAVVAKFDNATRVVTGFTTGGETIAFPSPSSAAVLAIRPSRGFTLRFQPQPDRPSAVVQDPDDGEFGARQVRYKANGDSVEVQLAKNVRALKDPASTSAMRIEEDCISNCSGDGGGGGGSPPSYGPATKIGLFELLDAYDFDNPYDTNEFRFETWLVQPNGNVLEHITTHADGLRGDTRNILQLPISSGSPNQFSGNYVALVIFEDDGWTGRDDFFDSIIRYTENAATGGWGNLPRLAGGGFRCDYQNSVGYHQCPLLFPDGVAFYWKQVNFNVNW